MVQYMFRAEQKLKIDHDIYRIQCVSLNKILRQARLNYYSVKIASCHRDPKNLFKIIRRSKRFSVPVGKLSVDFGQDFIDFFINKIEITRNDITSKSQVLAWST